MNRLRWFTRLAPRAILRRFHQRFSLATFVGVNFPLLREYFGEGKRCRYVEPAGEEGRGIHARLLAPKLAHEVFERFYERFGAAAHQRLQEPIQQARGVASRHAPLLCSFFEDMALGDPLTCRLYHRRLWFRA